MGARPLGKHLEPVIYILPNLILCDPIALLDFAFKLVATAIDRSKIVICELAPLLLYAAAELLPISFNAVPIHCVLLQVVGFVKRPRWAGLLFHAPLRESLLYGVGARTQVYL